MRIKSFLNSAQSKIRTEDSLNLQNVPGTNQGRTIGKGSNELIKPMYKLAKPVTEISSKIYELLTYNKA